MENITGNQNFALGSEALRNTTGSHNLGIGYHTLHSNTVGEKNIAIGFQTLKSLTDGSNNIAIGHAAGMGTGLDTNTELKKGSGNVIIGNPQESSTSSSSTGGLYNSVLIGNGILEYDEIKNNTIVLGKKSDGSTYPKVGIGVYQPKAKLDVNGSIKISHVDAPCTQENKGSIRFNTSNDKFEACDGKTGWRSLY